MAPSQPLRALRGKMGKQASRPQPSLRQCELDQVLRIAGPLELVPSRCQPLSPLAGISLARRIWGRRTAGVKGAAAVAGGSSCGREFWKRSALLTFAELFHNCRQINICPALLR